MSKKGHGVDVETLEHGKTLKTAAGTISSATTTAAIAAGAAGIKTYVYSLIVNGVSSTLNNVDIKAGTTLKVPLQIQSSGDVTTGAVYNISPPGSLFESAAAEAINIVTDDAATVKYSISYWQE